MGKEDEKVFIESFLNLNHNIAEAQKRINDFIGIKRKPVKKKKKTE